MEDMVIIPLNKEVHPVTAVALSYLNDKVSMKLLDEWKVFFKKRSEKNKLAKQLFDTSERLIVGEQVTELDFLALMWMILKFNREKELEIERVELEKEIYKLRKMVKG